MTNETSGMNAPAGPVESEVLSGQPARPRRKCGFATMPPERVRELASKGGIAAHRVGTAHKFNSEEARVAGRKGGLARATVGQRTAD
jgi:general stress protein YciG